MLSSRAPEVVRLGFSIPTFDNDTSFVNQRSGEALRDRDRRVCGVVFRDQLGNVAHFYISSSVS